MVKPTSGYVCEDVSRDHQFVGKQTKRGRAGLNVDGTIQQTGDPDVTKSRRGYAYWHVHETLLIQVHFLLLAITLTIRLQAFQHLDVDLYQQFSRQVLGLQPQIGAESLIHLFLRFPTSQTADSYHEAIDFELLQRIQVVVVFLSLQNLLQQKLCLPYKMSHLLCSYLIDKVMLNTINCQSRLLDIIQQKKRKTITNSFP